MTTTTTSPSTPAPARSKDAARRAQRLHSGAAGYWFLAPFALVFVAFLVGPILYGIWMSLTDRSLIGLDASVVGIENYTEALTDPEMWQTLWQTLFFTIISTIPLVIVALVLAVLVYTGLPGQWLWRFAFFASFLLPVVVVTDIWGWMFNPEFGLFNTFLTGIGLDPVGWLTDERVAMWSIALATVWWTVGFNFLLYLAALQAIPEHHYEAAAIDGAGAWRRLWSITLPQLRRITGVVVVLQLLASLKVFDQIYLFTAGGPGGSTRSVLIYIYDTGFVNYRLGYSAAISFIFFALIVLLSLTRLFATRREANDG